MNRPIPIIANSASDSVEQICESAGLYVRDGVCELQVCGTPEEMDEYLERCGEDGCSRIIVAGGDGTVRRALNQLGARLAEIEVGILPAGTGNDFARSLDIPVHDIEMALRLAVGGDVSTVDLMTIDDDELPIVVNSVSAGATPEQRPSDESKAQWGAMAYWTSAVGALSDPPQRTVQFRYDDEKLEIDVHAFAVCNGRTVGGGFPVAAEALLNDGMCDVVLLPSQPLSQTLQAVFDVLLRHDSGSERVVRRRAQRIGIQADEPMELSIDGDTVMRRAFELRVGERTFRAVHGPKAALR